MHERYINPKNIDLKLGALESGGELLIPLSAVRAAIAAAPSEDVVEVVRCKDCEYWQEESYDTITENRWGVCRQPLGDYRYSEVYENDFCSYGERRTQNEQAD